MKKRPSAVCLASLFYFSAITILYAQGSACHETKAELPNIAKSLLPDGQPIVKVKKEFYVKHPKPGVGIGISTWYIGPGLERVETQTVIWRSDEPMEPVIRYSKDNGRTWSEFETTPPIMTFKDKYNIYWGGGQQFYDAVSKVHLSFWLRQTIFKEPLYYYNQSFCRISDDNARSWSEPQMLKYEVGADFDPNNPLNPDYLKNNQMYPGNNIIRHSNGTIISVGTSMNIPKDAPDPDPERKYAGFGSPAGARDIGSACLIGRWDEKKRQYQWQCGQIVWVPKSVSNRGLDEAEIAELADGRVLVVWRGSDTPVTAGRKWFSVYDDGGMTLSRVQELKYDDGSRFYSPSSFHRMIRHSITGKLYWTGNICQNPPTSNHPRYPLVIAEVDEAIPALKRSTVTIIDDRQPQDSKFLQLSNFSLLENRETHNLELYLTRLGAGAIHDENTFNYPDFWQSDCYRYTLSFD